MRRLLYRNRAMAGFVIALALMMKIAIPGGFMPTVSDGRIVISLCSGTGPMEIGMVIPGVAQGKHAGGTHHDKAGEPCAFAALTIHALAGADPVLLASAILFVLTLGMRATSLTPNIAKTYLRPPLRGPPATG